MAFYSLCLKQFSSLTERISEIFNAEVIFREDCTPDEFIDVVVGNRVYVGCLYVRLGEITSKPNNFLGVQQN